jgi:hypothetical protein
MARLRIGKAVITGAVALGLVAGGTAAGAAIASGPVDGSGVIHGCWTNAAINGTHVFVLQDAGTNCPKGTTAISWNQTGPAGAAGATGPTGPAGPAGAVGAPGPTGSAGPAGPIGDTGPPGPSGANGNTVLNGTGAPANTVGNNGDFYIDTAADVLYGPKAGGAWPTTGTSLVGNPGATGPTGPAGPQGPAGPAGISGSVSDLSNLTCITSGGANGNVSVNTASDNSVTLKCVPPSTDANCTHSDGIGQNYTDCNDLLGMPGTDSSYNQTMATDAATAYSSHGPLAGTGEIVTGVTALGCLPGTQTADTQIVLWETFNQTGPVTWVAWAYGGLMAGYVHTFTGTSLGQTSLCPTTSDPTWN